jgi:hypothetical protein
MAPMAVGLRLWALFWDMNSHDHQHLLTIGIIVDNTIHFMSSTCGRARGGPLRPPERPVRLILSGRAHRTNAVVCLRVGVLTLSP